MSGLRAHETHDGDGKIHQVQHIDIQSNGRSRPVSLYDNFQNSLDMPPLVTSPENLGDENSDQMTSQSYNSHRNNNQDDEMTKNTDERTTANSWVRMSGEGKKSQDFDKAPSMAPLMATTVPVNVVGPQIAGRHTPTRSSLRHSRMIVMHSHGNMPRKSSPPLLKHSKAAHILAASQTIFGIVITSLSLWLLLWAPNLPLTDHPYWSGIPLLLSGTFGLTLLCLFKEKEYPGMKPGCCLSSTAVFSMMLAILAGISCLAACVTATIHLSKLSGLECTPAQVTNVTCACRARSEFASPSEPLLKYVDLNCPEVEGILTILLIFSATCNALGTIVAIWYLGLHCSPKKEQLQYAKVRTSARSTASGLDSRPIYIPPSSRR